MATNGESKGIQPKITLYTNHLCPFAHRAHITLQELGLPYEEVIIDLDRPREPWYLEINPRGLVPSIKYTVPGLYDEEIITESAIVAQFLADIRPENHLLPESLHDPFSALFRARLAFFVDTWNGKVQGNMYPMMKAEGQEKEKLAKETLEQIEKEIEPLLKNAAPFFGGKDRPTLAEAIIAPFLLRFFAFSNDDLLPKSFGDGIKALPNTGKWAQAVVKLPSVLSIWDENKIIERTTARVAKMKEAAK